MPVKPADGGRVDLGMLGGTEDSIQSNFEALCCKLYQAEFPEAEINRLSPPDYGIDFIGELPQGVIAFQCKYFLGRIGHSRIQQIQKSFTTALLKRSSMVQPWKEYHLLIASDPTAKEYQTIQHGFGILKEKHNAHDSTFRLVGKTKIEQLLAKHLYLWQEYRSPIVLIEYQPGLPFPLYFFSQKRRKGDITVYCRSKKYGTTVRAHVSPDISCGALAKVFATQLGFPFKEHSPAAMEDTEYNYELESQTGERFSNDSLIKDAGVKDGDVLFLIRITKPQVVQMMDPDIYSFDLIYHIISSECDFSDLLKYIQEKKSFITLFTLFFTAIDIDEALWIRERAIQLLAAILSVDSLRYDYWKVILKCKDLTRSVSTDFWLHLLDTNRLDTAKFIRFCDQVALMIQQAYSVNDLKKWARELLIELENVDRNDMPQLEYLLREFYRRKRWGDDIWRWYHKFLDFSIPNCKLSVWGYELGYSLIVCIEFREPGTSEKILLYISMETTS